MSRVSIVIAKVELYNIASSTSGNMIEGFQETIHIEPLKKKKTKQKNKQTWSIRLTKKPNFHFSRERKAKEMAYILMMLMKCKMINKKKGKKAQKLYKGN